MYSTYKSLLVLSFQKRSQNDLRFLILNTEVESVLGSVGGWWSVCCGGGEDVISNNDGLEQLPSAALDNEPLCIRVLVDGGGDAGVEGLLDSCSFSRLTTRTTTMATGQWWWCYCRFLASRRVPYFLSRMRRGATW